MEAPPPPGMNYNEFRTWRRNSSIHGTTRDLSDAWRDYSKSTSRKGSPRQSPRASPTRYGGLARATLTGLPPDVSRIIASSIGGREVLPMQRATAGTRKMTEENLRRLCDEPLTQREILASLDQLPSPLGVGIVRAHEATLETLLKKGELYLITRDEDDISVENLSTKDREEVGPDWKTARVFIEAAFDGRTREEYATQALHLSPPSLLHAYERRLSCQRVDPAYLTRIRKRVTTYLLEVAMIAIQLLLVNAALPVDLRFLYAAARNMVLGLQEVVFDLELLAPVGEDRRYPRMIAQMEAAVRRVAWVCDSPFLTTQLAPLLGRFKVSGNRTAYAELVTALVSTLRRTYQSLL